MKKYIYKHKGIFLLMLLVELLVFLFQATSYFVQMKLINTVLEGNIKKLAIQMGTVITFWLIATLFDFWGEAIMSKLIEMMNCDLRNDLSYGIKNMNYQNFHEKNIGEYISWYTNDLNQIEQLGFRPYFQFVSCMIQACVAFIALFFLHWFIALIILLLTIIMTLVPKIFDTKMNKIGKCLSSSQDKFLEKAKDILSGFDVTKTFDKMLRFTTNMNEATNSFESDRYQFAFQKSRNSHIVQGIGFVFQIAASFVIFLFAILKITPIGTVYGSGSLVNMLFSATQNMLILRVSISASKPFFKKLEHYSSDSKEETVKEKLPQLPSIQKNITLENLSYSYGTKQIFNHDNFTFEISKKYALTGPSGSGKSTLLKILLGELKDYKGIVRFDGNNIKSYDSDSIFKYIAYISQDIFLFNTTIQDNITLGDDFNEDQLFKAMECSALTDDIKSMPKGLETLVGENGSHLSGGQKQRIAIARAIIHHKSIILMDEGTSALDRKNAEVVENKLLFNSNITLILVSHHLNETEIKYFDQIYKIGDA